MRLLRGLSSPARDRESGPLAFCPGSRALEVARAAPPVARAHKPKAKALTICLARLTKAAIDPGFLNGFFYYKIDLR